MKKTFLSKLLIGFSIVLLFVYTAIYACSDDGDWGIFFDSNFTPETFVDKSYSPLFLSTDVFYSNDYENFDTKHIYRFNDEIVQDWTTYLKGNLKSEQVKFFLIDSSAIDVNKLYSFYTTKKTNPFSTNWSKKINLKDKKTKDFIEFLYLSQKIESSSKNNPWDYEESAKVFSNPKWVSEIAKKYSQTTDPFLKNRYWFQVIKSCFYSNIKISAVSFFQKTESLVPKNTLYYRALAYVAGVNYKSKNYALSNFQYSQVFDKCPTMRVVSAYCFHPQENLDWNQSLSLAKTNDEKAALWAIQGYYGDEHRAIEKIYELNPKSEHLEFLLTRLINHQETKIDSYEKDEKVIAKFKKTNDSLNKINLQLVNKIAKSNNTSKPYLWNIAAGYLETLNGNYAQADQYFNQTESKMPKTEIALDQLRLLRFVNNLSKIKNINSENQKTILADLTWLYDELPKQNNKNFRYQNATSWSKNYLSDLYKFQKNNVMAELFNRNPEFYDNENDLQAMKNFLTKDNKTTLEKIAQKVYNVSIFEINNYQAIQAAFQNKIPEAIAFLEKTDTLQHINFLGNPFNGNIQDCHDCDFVAFQKRKYSQIQFLNTIKEMQEKVAKNEEVYTNSLLLGNAFYNITHFGNARLFYEGNIVGYGSNPYYFRDNIRKMITNCSVSKMYYEKAFAAAKNNEQKAKCQYMLAKCERNEYYNHFYDPKKNQWENSYAAEESKINFLAWSGFKALKKEYSNTKYYQDVIAECGYFNSYVSKK